MAIPSLPGTSGTPAAFAIARAQFVAQRIDDLGLGAYECHAIFRAQSRQYRPFRKEAVAGVQAVAAALLGRMNDQPWIQIAFRRSSRPQHDCAICPTRSGSFAVCVGNGHYRLDIKRLGRPYNA